MHPSRFTLIAFLSWLHTLPANKIVGNINHSRLCPLANFLLTASGRASLVRTRTYQSPSWASVEDLPEWAAHFALLLDHVYMLDDRGAYRPLYNVTVQQCIEVLSIVHQWETGYVLLRPHACTPLLPFSVLSSLRTPHAERRTLDRSRPVVPLGSVLFASILTPGVPGIAAEDDLSDSWRMEVA